MSFIELLAPLPISKVDNKWDQIPLSMGQQIGRLAHRVFTWFPSNAVVVGLSIVTIGIASAGIEGPTGLFIGLPITMVLAAAVNAVYERHRIANKILELNHVVNEAHLTLRDNHVVKTRLRRETERKEGEPLENLPQAVITLADTSNNVCRVRERIIHPCELITMGALTIANFVLTILTAGYSQKYCSSGCQVVAAIGWTNASMSAISIVQYFYRHDLISDIATECERIIPKIEEITDFFNIHIRDRALEEPQDLILEIALN